MTLRAGQLRHSVGIYNRITIRNSYGASKRQWSLYATRRADVRTLTGRALFFAAQQNESVTHLVIMRGASLPDLTSKSRLKWQGKTLEVESVIDEDGRGNVLELSCKRLEDKDAL